MVKAMPLLLLMIIQRFTWVIFLAHKDEAFKHFEIFCKRIQREQGCLISSIRSDHGGEFENKLFEIFCNEHGFSHNFSSPRTPQQMELLRERIKLYKKW